MIDYPVPLLGIAASSGTGKTTLLEQLIPALRAAGLRIALIKHSHHDFEIDKAGKDTDRLRRAGATQVVIASRYRKALIIETPERDDEPDLAEALAHLDPTTADLVLVEGYRHQAFPKLELHRPSLGKPLLCTADANIIAIAHDAAEPLPVTLPQLDLNDPAKIAAFVLSTR